MGTQFILECTISEAIRCARLTSTNHFAIFHLVGTPTHACPVNKIINPSHAVFQCCSVLQYSVTYGQRIPIVMIYLRYGMSRILTLHIILLACAGYMLRK